MQRQERMYGHVPCAVQYTKIGVGASKSKADLHNLLSEEMRMELTQGSRIKHPVIHRTARISNIIEQVAFLPESQRPAWNVSYPISRSGRITFPEFTSYHISVQSNQGPSKETKNWAAIYKSKKGTGSINQQNGSCKLTWPNRIARGVHVILCQASAGWSFAEMRKVGRTDDAELSSG